MTSWEYRVLSVHVHAAQPVLSDLGAEGWELVQVLPGLNAENQVVYLKRPTE